MSLVSLVAAEGAAHLISNPVVAVLIRIGQKTFLFLWTQFIVFAVLGSIAAATGSHLFQLSCAIAAIPLVTAAAYVWPVKIRPGTAAEV